MLKNVRTGSLSSLLYSRRYLLRDWLWCGGLWCGGLSYRWMGWHWRLLLRRTLNLLPCCAQVIYLPRDLLYFVVEIPLVFDKVVQSRLQLVYSCVDF